MNSQRGTSLIEVLVTMVILAFGLLGAAGLQARLQLADMEAYQRAQALILVDDIANRIATNRAHAAAYVTGAGNPLGTGMVACPTPSTTATLQQTDAAQWCNALLGVAEVTGAGNIGVGAMLGARGCVESLPSSEYLVTVAWQGLVPISAPPTSVACGANQYNGAVGSTSSNCASDRCRRVFTTIVRIAGLT